MKKKFKFRKKRVLCELNVWQDGSRSLVVRVGRTRKSYLNGLSENDHEFLLDLSKAMEVRDIRSWLRKTVLDEFGIRL